MYTDTVVELSTSATRAWAAWTTLACLLDTTTGVLNEQGEIIFVFGDAGMGQVHAAAAAAEPLGSGPAGPRDQVLLPTSAAAPSAASRKARHCVCRTCSSSITATQSRTQGGFCLPAALSPHTALFTFDGLDELHSDFDLSSEPDTSSP